MQICRMASGPKGRRFKSCHLDQKTAGNFRISGFFLCNLHKGVSLVPFPCNYFATFQNVPKGRKYQYVVVLQFSSTTYCIFITLYAIEDCAIFEFFANSFNSSVANSHFF